MITAGKRSLSLNVILFYSLQISLFYVSLILLYKTVLKVILMVGVRLSSSINALQRGTDLLLMLQFEDWALLV